MRHYSHPVVLTLIFPSFFPRSSAIESDKTDCAVCACLFKGNCSWRYKGGAYQEDQKSGVGTLGAFLLCYGAIMGSPKPLNMEVEHTPRSTSRVSSCSSILSIFSGPPSAILGMDNRRGDGMGFHVHLLNGSSLHATALQEITITDSCPSIIMDRGDMDGHFLWMPMDYPSRGPGTRHCPSNIHRFIKERREKGDDRYPSATEANKAK